MQESRVIRHLKRLRKRQEREMEKKRNAILNNSEPEKITYTDYSNTFMYQTESNMNIPSFTHESIANMINSVDMPIEKYLDVSGNMDLTKNLGEVSEVKEILEDKVSEVVEQVSEVKEHLEEKVSEVKELLEEKVAQVQDLKEKVSEQVDLIVDSVTTQVESILSSSEAKNIEQGLVTIRDVGAEALKLASDLKIPDAKCCTVV